MSCSIARIFLMHLIIMLSGCITSSAVRLHVSWANDAKPNQTVLVAGSGFSNSTLLEISSPAITQPLLISPLDSGPYSLAALLPTNISLGIYTLRAVDGASKSNELTINAPKLWWAQGRCGNFTVPGGWIRLFGTGFCIGSVNSAKLSSEQITALRGQAQNALDAGDYGLLRELSERLNTADTNQKGGDLSHETDGCATTLQLRGPDSNFTLQSSASTNYEASFTLPASVPPGEHAIFVKSQLSGPSENEWLPLDSFVSPLEPHVSSILIKPDASRSENGDASDPRSFAAINPCEMLNRTAVLNVVDFAPSNLSINNPEIGTADATPALQRCIDAAAASPGGATCFFPSGQFLLKGPLKIPQHVYLRGAGMGLTSIYWEESNCTSWPRHTAHITGGDITGGGSQTGEPYGSGGWGLADLTIYVSAYYRIFLTPASNTTQGFRMQRVRVRANAYFGATWGPFTTSNRPRPNVNFNFSKSDVFELLVLLGSNYEVRDCDLYGTNAVLGSGGSGNGYGGNAYGWISGNQIWNGGAAHASDQWKQVIFEHNTIVGISLTAGGNVVGSYNGGFAQHLYFSSNSYQHVWGGDREVLTHDNAGGAYFGSVRAHSTSTSTSTSTNTSASTVTITTTGARIPLNRSTGMNSGNGGGWVVVGGALLVLNGSGAGQVRRIVGNSDPYTWTLDRPLDAIDLESEAPLAPSFVQIMPFRGLNLFWNNSYADTGAFQYYGIGISTIASHNSFARVTGAVNWGQWRQWHSITPAPPASAADPHRRLAESVVPSASAVGLGATGEMGCGANPNWYNIFEANEFTEGNAMRNWNTAQGANYNWGHGYVFSTGSGGGAGGASGHRFEQLSMNMWLLYRENRVASNGGIWITDDATAVVAEGNIIGESTLSVRIRVDNSTRNVLVRANLLV